MGVVGVVIDGSLRGDTGLDVDVIIDVDVFIDVDVDIVSGRIVGSE